MKGFIINVFCIFVLKTVRRISIWLSTHVLVSLHSNRYWSSEKRGIGGVIFGVLEVLQNIRHLVPLVRHNNFTCGFFFIFVCMRMHLPITFGRGIDCCMVVPAQKVKSNENRTNQCIFKFQSCFYKLRHPWPVTSPVELRCKGSLLLSMPTRMQCAISSFIYNNFP